MTQLHKIKNTFIENLNGSVMCRISVSAVILAGGKNTRMGGKDKSLLTLNGTTFIETIRNKLENHLSEIFVVCNSSIISSRFFALLSTGNVISLSPNDLYLLPFLEK